MATRKKVKKEEVKVFTPITEEDIISAAQRARSKMKNVKKTVQAQGRADIIEFNERFKAQPQQIHPAWKK